MAKPIYKGITKSYTQTPIIPKVVELPIIKKQLTDKFIGGAF